MTTSPTTPHGGHASATHTPSPRVSDPITIKKYANRRLYNTATSTYVTLEDLAQMVKVGEEFNVYDAKSGEDITRSVLTQIIVEEENKGQNLLPIGFLRQLISFYGNNLQTVLPSYLEQSMGLFNANRDMWQNYMKEAVGKSFNPIMPLAALEEASRRNLSLFQEAMQKAMGFFNPFDGKTMPTGMMVPPAMMKTPEAPEATKPKARLDDLKQRLAEMQREVDALKGEQ
ncbi:MAG: polyhydroxyalkanoate synthesis repressor PhaR [Alphaproteobacteria bacterium]|nr:polyhydroxyalkanoate synthesis repressor PhaR [Alphaproteobacteria bacterium]NDG05436.1 polyhydroxyalkanoate synthesis repressor PhaR [Alphaproteobacteria bacterium]